MKKFTFSDFEKNHAKMTKRWLSWLSICLLVLVGQTTFAQVNAYAFAQSEGTYQSIVADGQVVTGSEADAVNTFDGSGWNVPLPFTFNFNSVNFDAIFVNSNGGATFGTTTSTGSALISTTTAYDGAIGVMNRDLWGIFFTSGITTTGSNVITNVGSFRGLAVGKLLRVSSGVPANTTVTAFDQAAGTITISNNVTAGSATASVGWGTGRIITKTEGTAPNRTFIIQWEGFNDYTTAASSSNYLSFQLRLNETSNTVQIVYGEHFNISTTARTNQIGLRGGTATMFSNRSGAAGAAWTATTNGTVNNATVSRNNLVFPAPGLTFTWTPPTCLPPTGLNVSNVTTTSALLGWTNPGTVFNIEWGLQGFTPGTGTTVTNVTSGYALTGLTASTSYSYYVRQNCGATDGLSVWAGPFNFVTLCTALTQFTENFDSYTATGATNPLPNCWSRFGNTGSSFITTGSVAPLTPPNRLLLSATATGTTLNAIAVLPPVTNLQAGTHRLKFKAFCTTANKFLEIGYYEISTDPTSFVVLETFAMPSTAIANSTEFIYIPQFVPAGVQSLAFRVNGPAFTGTTAINIDDVVWEALPLCGDITVFELANITSSGIEVLWNPGGSETAWQYVYGLSTVTDPNTLTPVNVNSIPYFALSDLAPNTTYRLWIRSNCGNGALGNWSNPQQFTTACSAVLAFSENFDTSLTGSTNPLPNCWLRAGNGSTFVTTGGVAPGSAPNRLYMLANGVGTTPTEGIAIMPAVSNLAAGTHRLKFSAYATVAGRSVEVGYYINEADLSSYVALQTIPLTTTTAATAATYVINPTGIPAGATRLAFKNTALPGSTTLYIDDVVWEVQPLCPDVNTVSVGNITSTSAGISWTPGGSETAWQYVFGLATATDPTTLTPVDVLANPQAVIANLLPSTAYRVWVRSICGTNLGAYSLASNFVTACAPITTLPWNEGFENIATVSTTAFPPCWLEQNGDWASSTDVTYNTPRTGTKYIRNSWSATNEFMWTPGFELTAGTSYDFSFFMQGDGFTGWNIDVFFNTTQSSVNATQLGNTNIPSGSGSALIQPYSLVNNAFVPTTSGVYYFAIRVNQPNTAPWYVAFDDFKLELSPPCVQPTTQPATAVTATAATLNWVAPFTPPAAGYDYFLTNNLTLIPDASTIPTGTVAAGITTINLTSLTPITNYRFFVRSSCSATEKSAWSGAANFTTACDIAVTFSENFDTSLTGATNPLPNCWLRAGNGSTFVTTGGVAPGSAPNRLYMLANGVGTTPTEGIAIMPAVSNLAAGTHRLKFSAYATVAGRSVEVGYYTNEADLSSYVALQTIPLTAITPSTAVTYSINPTGIPAGATRLAFKNTGLPGSTTLYIDNVVWEVQPLCPDVNTVSVGNITSTSAAISWTPGGSETAWQYVFGLATVTDPTTLTPVDVLANPQAVIANLLPSTAYRVWVRSICGTNLGAYSLASNFVTACAPITTLPWNEGFENIATVSTTAFPPCWLEQNGDWASSTDVIYNTPRTGTKYIRNSWSATNEFMWTPGFELTAGTSYDFSFFMQGDGFTGWNIDVFFNTTQTSVDATQLGSTNVPSGSGSALIQPYSLVNNAFIPATSGVYYFAIRVNQPNTAPWYVAFDDFKLELTPACVAPQTAATTNITTVSATINWTAPAQAPANGYDYFVSTDTTAPTSTTTPTGSVVAGITTANLTSLSSSTLYRFYVRSVCSVTDKSSWSSAGTFTTLCNATSLPYSIDFESVTVPNLPLCTINQNVGTGNNWVTSNNPGSGFTNRTLSYTYNLTEAANTWFFTNQVNLTAGLQYSVSYRYGTNSSTLFTENLKVAYGSAANSGAMTTQLANHPSITGTTPQNNSVTFTASTSGAFVFGFHAYSIADQNSLYLDDIMIQEVLSNTDFDAKKFTAYPNPVKDKLTIRYTDAITSATVYNLLGQQMFVKNINATEGQIDMSNLSTGTYLVKVISGNKIETIKVIKQ